MSNKESVLGMPPKEAISYEQGFLKNLRKSEELQRALDHMSEQEINNQIIKLGELKQGLRERKVE